MIRRFEETAAKAYAQGKFGGFCHLYIGQEACAAGSVSALVKGDKYITAYRDHAHPLALGTDPKAIMAELFGKATGISKGKGGSMHMFDKEKGFFGGHGIVGGQIPLGTGIGFAEKYNKSKNICVCFMGDGAVRQGAFHESLNLAMTLKIPTVFVIENNGYAMGTSVERTANHTEIWKLGLGYEMPSEPVDGMDPVAMTKAVEKAVKRARKGGGPTFLEAKTYRYKGHSMSDAQHYRTKDEVNEYQKIDPINTTLEFIKENKYASDKEIEAINQEVKETIADAIKFAEESPFPVKQDLYDSVYEQEDYPFIKD